MFTGIIEEVGEILHIEVQESNWLIQVQSKLSNELKIDQSLAHEGICLTVVETGKDWHRVVAIKETLSRSAIQQKKVGSAINLERAMILNARLDGHLVQGHVDTTAVCSEIIPQGGSYLFTFQCNHPEFESLVVDKGSVTINGVSLTVISPEKGQFQVAIIPYTFKHTTFRDLQINELVNIEFDIIGKYVAKHLQAYQ